jgi:mono/diheme cytochrome c family protein
MLGSVVTLALILLLSVIGERETARLATAARIDQARRIEQGAALYAQNCRTCHGVNGEGLGALGPALHDAHFFTGRLPEVGWSGSLHDYVVATIAAGRVTATRPLYTGDGVVVMPPWARANGGPLRDDQIEALAAFVLNWEATALGEVVLSPLPTPTPLASNDHAQLARGRQLFDTAGCTACHGEDAAGVEDAGPSLLGIGAAAGERAPGVAAADYLRASVLAPAAWVVEGYTQPGECAAVVSDAQLADLVAYLLTVQ